MKSESKWTKYEMVKKCFSEEIKQCFQDPDPLTYPPTTNLILVSGQRLSGKTRIRKVN